MRIARGLIFILVACCLGACARPLVVKEVATVSEPLLADVQRSTKFLQQQFSAQRKDLALSKADHEGLRIEPARMVNLTETLWQDLGRAPERAQLVATRQLDQQIRTDPYAALTTSTLVSVAPVAAPNLAGLIDAARAIERMKRDRKTSLAEIGSFAASVQEELKKLEDETKQADE